MDDEVAVLDPEQVFEPRTPVAHQSDVREDEGATMHLDQRLARRRPEGRPHQGWTVGRWRRLGPDFQRGPGGHPDRRACVIPGALDPDPDPLAQARHPLAEEEAEVAPPGARRDVEGQFRHGRGECRVPCPAGNRQRVEGIDGLLPQIRGGRGHPSQRRPPLGGQGLQVARDDAFRRERARPGGRRLDAPGVGRGPGHARGVQVGDLDRPALPRREPGAPAGEGVGLAEPGEMPAGLGSLLMRDDQARRARPFDPGERRPEGADGHRIGPGGRRRAGDLEDRPPAREQAPDQVNPPHAGRAGRLARDQRAGTQDQRRSRDGDLGRAAGQVERRPGRPAHEGPVQPDPRRPLGRGLGRSRPEERERPPGRVEDRDRAVAERQVGPLAEEERRAVEGEVGDVHDQVEPVEDEPLPVEDEDRREPPPLEEVDLRFRDPDDRPIPRAGANQARLAGDPQVVLDERPVIGDLDRPPVHVEGSPQGRHRVGVVGRRDAADRDEGAVEAVGDLLADPVGDEPCLDLGAVGGLGHARGDRVRRLGPGHRGRGRRSRRRGLRRGNRPDRCRVDRDRRGGGRLGLGRPGDGLLRHAR